MRYKFEKLEVWNLAVELSDYCYTLCMKLPDQEKFNLASQLRRASTSIALNIAEGSTSQSDKEQARFLSYAIRSFTECIACIRLISQKGYIENQSESELMQKIETTGEKLFKKLHAFRNSIS